MTELAAAVLAPRVHAVVIVLHHEGVAAGAYALDGECLHERDAFVIEHVQAALLVDEGYALAACAYGRHAELGWEAQLLRLDAAHVTHCALEV